MDLSRVEALHARVRHCCSPITCAISWPMAAREPADGGLSLFGRQVVREMNRLGMVVDCSHTGRRSSLEAIELSVQPTIFSTPGAYAVCAHIRNIRDEQIRACAAGRRRRCRRDRRLHWRCSSAQRNGVFVTSITSPRWWGLSMGLGADYACRTCKGGPRFPRRRDYDVARSHGTQLYEGGCFQPGAARGAGRDHAGAWLLD